MICTLLLSLSLVGPPESYQPLADTSSSEIVFLPATRDWPVPRWVVQGILAVETLTELSDVDAIMPGRYARAIGSAGERGIMQITWSAAHDCGYSLAQWKRLRYDDEESLACGLKILQRLRKRCGSWGETIRAWNAGHGGRRLKVAHSYERKVNAAAYTSNKPNKGNTK